ncbi:MAG: single-stranded DNA-binding protein [Deltaproteobacteria bacterium]|nr:MAG: single-stranded DNA-binding protein [Deltaproteobacteria bacterium]
MAGVNKVILVGHLGADPEMKYGSSGNPFTTFNLATSDSWVKDGQREERTEWHRIIAFGKLAEICAKWLHKGKQIYLEGRLQTRSWEQDGVKRYTTEIIAGNMQMLGSRDGAQGGGQGGGYGGGQNSFGGGQNQNQGQGFAGGAGQSAGQGGGFAAPEPQAAPAAQAPYGQASAPDSGPDDIPF